MNDTPPISIAELPFSDANFYVYKDACFRLNEEVRFLQRKLEIVEDMAGGYLRQNERLVEERDRPVNRMDPEAIVDTVRKLERKNEDLQSEINWWKKHGSEEADALRTRISILVQAFDNLGRAGSGDYVETLYKEVVRLTELVVSREKSIKCAGRKIYEMATVITKKSPRRRHRLL